MRTSAMRRTYIELDQDKLKRARTALGTKTVAETVDRALDLAAAEAAIDAALQAAGGKGRLRKVFR